MSFIDKLPQKWSATDFNGNRINMLKDGVVTLVGIKRLESEALFTSSEGIGTLRETASVEFAGKERYWWLARKVNGVLRRVSLSELNIENCTVDKPCIRCEVCSLFGGLNTDDNTAYFSRVKFQDLISLQEYVYDEKFRVKLPEKTQDTPVPFQEVIVPPGTEFPFIVRIIKPSKRDLAIFFYGNQIADGLGYGNYSKLRGDASTQWLMMTNGFAHISMHELLINETNGKSIEQQIEEFSKSPKGPVEKDGILIKDDLTKAINELLKNIK